MNPGQSFSIGPKLAPEVLEHLQNTIDGFISYRVGGTLLCYKMLSDSDAEFQDLHTLTINDHYAKAFQYRKEREELARLKEKYGSDISDVSAEDDSDDSEDTSEDSDGAELTPAVDAAILRTLARIRKKDPEIYNGEKRVFEEEENRTSDRAPLVKTKTRDKSKLLTIRQAVLSAALQDGQAPSRSPSPPPLTHVDEQNLLQSETRAAFHGAIDLLNIDAEDDEDLLIPRSRTRDEAELEEEEYKTFLEREVGEDLQELITVDQSVAREDAAEEDDRKERKKSKKERKNDKVISKDAGATVTNSKMKSKEDEDHEFLMNYIFNRGWVDHSKQRIPTYNEIVDSSGSSKVGKTTLHNGDGDSDVEAGDERGQAGHGPTLSDEETFDDLADAFETSYNFRFEEPNGALIASHPRNVTSVRRESTTRKDARQRRKERKEIEKNELLNARKEEIKHEREKIERQVAHELGKKSEGENEREMGLSRREEKKAELTRLKDLKAKELRRKLERVSAEGGLRGEMDEALGDLDLDTPWDPEKHDAQMAALYGTGDDPDDDTDLEKPAWEDDIDIDDIVSPSKNPSKEDIRKLKKREKKKAKKKIGESEEEDGVDVDAMDADINEEGWESVDDEDWDGTEETRKRKVDQYMDEVVNRLGFNDITANIPTRFHYTQTTSENYGLSPVEILLASEAELNSYVSLRKMAPYRRTGRSGKEKSWDPKRNERLKEFREKLRARIGIGGEGAWSIGGIYDRNRSYGGSDGGEKKKRLGKKERAKMKNIIDEKTGEQGEDEITKQGPEPQDRDMEPVSKKRKHDPSADRNAMAPAATHTTATQESGTPKRKRRRRHKKGSGAKTGEETVE
ncbi:hypothetical protein ID866_7334 [Astraeus odoratus]|nr:hypothetical protein ID866_7334 [Astraeus odoratus]